MTIETDRYNILRQRVPKVNNTKAKYFVQKYKNIRNPLNRHAKEYSEVIFKQKVNKSLKQELAS